MSDIPISTMGMAPNQVADAPEKPADPLLLCMAMVAKALGHPVHMQVLRSGFTLDAKGRVPLAAYPDMAHQHGLMAAWSRTPVNRIPSYALPVLMPLKDGRACILKAINNDKAQVFWAESGFQEHEIPVAELQALARDEVLVVKGRSAKVSPVMA